MMFRKADYEKDHKAILQIAKTSKHTKDYGNFMFSGPDAYDKGWIRVMYELVPRVPVTEFMSETDLLMASEKMENIIGFTCRRDKVRVKETVLYFVGLQPLLQGSNAGLGWQLVTDMMDNAAHNVLTLNCAKDNEYGLRFYRKHGFTEVGEALKGTGLAFRKEFT